MDFSPQNCREFYLSRNATSELENICRAHCNSACALLKGQKGAVRCTEVSTWRAILWPDCGLQAEVAAALKMLICAYCMLQKRNLTRTTPWYGEMYAYGLATAEAGVNHLGSSSTVFHMRYYHPHGEHSAHMKALYS